MPAFRCSGSDVPVLVQLKPCSFNSAASARPCKRCCSFPEGLGATVAFTARATESQHHCMFPWGEDERSSEALILAKLLALLFRQPKGLAVLLHCPFPPLYILLRSCFSRALLAAHVPWPRVGGGRFCFPL